MEEVQKPRDAVLDFWRGVSITLVVLGHLISFRLHAFFISLFDALPQSGFVRDFERVFFYAAYHAGDIGVGIFLVISGYIITKLLIEERERTGRIGIRAFYGRRFFRILPAYCFYLLCVAGFVALGWMRIVHFPFACVLFLANTSLASCGPVFHHFWSLSLEEQFYAVWPALLVVVPFALHARTVATLYVLFAAAAAPKIVPWAEWADHRWALASIAAGALYALSPQLRDRVRRVHAVGAAAALIILADLFFGVLHDGSAFSRFAYALLLPAAALYAIAMTYRFATFMRSRVFSAFVYLGLMSYSLYIWQNLFATVYIKYPVDSPLWWWWLMVPATLISYYLVERPALAWARKKYKPVTHDYRERQAS